MSNKVSSPVRPGDPDMADGNGAVNSKISENEAPEGLTEKDTIPDCLPDLEEELRNIKYSGKQNIKEELPVEIKENQAKNVDVTDKELEAQLTEEHVDEEGNTYYNTAGKRVPVSDMADYVRNRDQNALIEEFNVRICMFTFKSKLVIQSAYI